MTDQQTSIPIQPRVIGHREGSITIPASPKRVDIVICDAHGMFRRRPGRGALRHRHRQRRRDHDQRPRPSLTPGRGPQTRGVPDGARYWGRSASTCSTTCGRRAPAPAWCCWPRPPAPACGTPSTAARWRRGQPGVPPGDDPALGGEGTSRRALHPRDRPPLGAPEARRRGPPDSPRARRAPRDGGRRNDQRKCLVHSTSAPTRCAPTYSTSSTSSGSAPACRQPSWRSKSACSTRTRVSRHERRSLKPADLARRPPRPEHPAARRPPSLRRGPRAGPDPDGRGALHPPGPRPGPRPRPGTPRPAPT